MSELPESYDRWKLSSPEDSAFVEEVDEFGRTRDEYEADLADSRNDELWFNDFEDYPTEDPDSYPED